MNPNATTRHHYTTLPPSVAGSLCEREWETYRQSVGHFLAEGRDGQFVVIHESEVIGFWPDRRSALVEAYRRFPDGRFMVHLVAEWHDVPTIRIGVPLACSPTAGRQQSQETTTSGSSA